jgi:hypothetical protein
MAKIGATIEVKSEIFFAIMGTILVLALYTILFIILGVSYIVGTVAEKVNAINECMDSCCSCC